MRFIIASPPHVFRCKSKGNPHAGERLRRAGSPQHPSRQMLPSQRNCRAAAEEVRRANRTEQSAIVPRPRPLTPSRQHLVDAPLQLLVDAASGRSPVAALRPGSGAGRGTAAGPAPPPPARSACIRRPPASRGCLRHAAVPGRGRSRARPARGAWSSCSRDWPFLASVAHETNQPREPLRGHGGAGRWRGRGCRVTCGFFLGHTVLDTQDSSHSARR